MSERGARHAREDRTRTSPGAGPGAGWGSCDAAVREVSAVPPRDRSHLHPDLPSPARQGLRGPNRLRNQTVSLTPGPSISSTDQREAGTAGLLEGAARCPGGMRLIQRPRPQWSTARGITGPESPARAMTGQCPGTRRAPRFPTCLLPQSTEKSQAWGPDAFLAPTGRKPLFVVGRSCQSGLHRSELD